VYVLFVSASLCYVLVISVCCSFLWITYVIYVMLFYVMFASVFYVLLFVLLLAEFMSFYVISTTCVYDCLLFLLIRYMLCNFCSCHVIRSFWYMCVLFVL